MPYFKVLTSPDTIRTEAEHAGYHILTAATETICKMLNIKIKRLEQSAELLKALAHPERLRLLGVLRAGEQCVCHLTAVSGQRQPYVSQQLAYLRDAGILADRKEGLRVYYRIADTRVLPLLDALDIHGENALARTCDCPRCRGILETEAVC